FFFSSRRRHTRSKRDWSSDVCSSDLTRYSLALDFVGRERKLLSFVLAKGAPGARLSDVTKRIDDQTGLQALSSDEFGWMTIWYRSEERRVGKEGRGRCCT